MVALVAVLSLRAAGASGIEDATLKAIARYSASEDGAALIVIERGRERLREFQNGHRASEPLRIYSGTKLFWCLAVCAAQSDGLLSLDDPVSDTITEWKGNEARRRITIRQCLNFTSGLPPMDELHEDNVSDRNALAIKSSLATTPGTRFIYGPASMQVINEVLRRKLASKKQTPVQFLERRVLRPLGLGPQRYLPDRAGTPLMDAGFMLTPDQWLKIGKLMLNSGRPVISSEAFQACLTSTPASPAFGMGIWNNRLASKSDSRELSVTRELLKKWPAQSWRNGCLCKAAPSDLIACIGSHGQRIYVVPSQELIVLRMGVRGDFSDDKFLRLLFAK